MPEFNDPFLEGNEQIEAAIDAFHADRNQDTMIDVLEAIRDRMHADGHFIFPVIVDENDDTRFAFRTLQTGDGKIWNAVFTSKAEYEKGEESQIISNFIDQSLRFCLESDMEGFIINPWGRSFMLAKEMIDMIFKADGDTEFTVPEEPITEELLADGSFLKRAIGICNRNRTQLNLIKLSRILRDSQVWIPCSAILSDADYRQFEKAVMGAEKNGKPDSIIGTQIKSQDNIRLVPDILKSGEEFFFPVFTSEEEMGEYGEHFSKIQNHFLAAANLAKHNEKNVTGIVINAFSEPFVIPKEMFDIIAEMDSSLGEDR